MMNQFLFGIIGFLMLAIAGVGATELKIHSEASANTELTAVVEETPSAQENTASLQASAKTAETGSGQGIASSNSSSWCPPNGSSAFSDDDEEDEDEDGEDEDDDGEDEDEDGDEDRDERVVSVPCTPDSGVSSSASASVQSAAQVPASPQPSAPVPQTAPSATTFTMAQIATHNSAASCYSAINGSVYNLTSFVSRHPGGSAAIKSLCGVDGTAAYNGQHGGSGRPASELASLKIGVVAK